jgi:hypothetical protein
VAAVAGSQAGRAPLDSNGWHALNDSGEIDAGSSDARPGISCYFHDAAAAPVSDGVSWRLPKKSSAHQARLQLSRSRHSRCLSVKGLSGRISIAGLLRKAVRQVRAHLSTVPRHAPVPAQSSDRR